MLNKNGSEKYSIFFNWHDELDKSKQSGNYWKKSKEGKEFVIYQFFHVAAIGESGIRNSRKSVFLEGSEPTDPPIFCFVENNPSPIVPFEVVLLLFSNHFFGVRGGDSRHTRKKRFPISSLCTMTRIELG
jgi:hypothetical protein